MAYTTIIIKPKYKYKNVSVNLLTPKGLPDGTKYSYLDKDLENMNKNGIITNTNTFHIGDTMNLEMQAIGVSESFVGYNQYQYRNPGDTAYDKNVPNTDNYVEGTIPGWVLECPKCEVRGLFGRQNYISIEMDELAERYFTIRNLQAKQFLLSAGHIRLNLTPRKIMNKCGDLLSHLPQLVRG